MNRLSGVQKFSIVFSVTFLTCFLVMRFECISQPVHSYSESPPSQNANLTFYSPDEFIMEADPGEQRVPEAWTGIKSRELLQDSVYDYTRNCGVQAVRDVADQASQSIIVILRVAQPENAAHWFENFTTGGVTDFDILGFSHYANWSEVPLEEISTYVKNFRSDYGRQVMIMETAYPFTLKNDDKYNNFKGQQSLVEGYPTNTGGQYSYMKALAEQVITGGGSEIFYWESAWISSGLMDLWALAQGGRKYFF